MDFLLIILSIVGITVTYGLPGQEIPSPLYNRGLGIYDGNSTTIQKHPYLVAVCLNNYFTCAGTIVSRTWVLTIPQCGGSLNVSEVSVLAGSQDSVTGKRYQVQRLEVHPQYSQGDVLNVSEVSVLAGSQDSVTGKRYQVQRLEVHPQYGQGDVFDYEFLCIQVVGKFHWNSRIRPVRLPKSDPPVNYSMVVCGWGKDGSISSEGNSKQQLLDGEMEWVDKAICKSWWSYRNWSDSMACAYNQGKTTLCDGDWADPFVAKGVLYGMFLFFKPESECSAGALPVLIADVATGAPWIRKVTGAKYEDEKPSQ
ncbi:trypsin-3-like [Homalodisca vitripennis]|uniref:trypsin-3-like n=1 Tax=Homalodisca vitripennis TaxID=197043 RepID=UPI001EEA9D46|nr:trypsin-3-like [Homalodisca vitripennis]